MRRKKQEISRLEELEAIFNEAIVCRLALTDGSVPYIVPLSFGYREKMLYFHSAGEGKKLELLSASPDVCFEVEAGVGIVRGKTACNWGVSYRSIIGYGRAEILSDPAEKRRALDIIMAHYSDGQFEYADSNLSRTTVFKVVISSMTGKRSADQDDG